MDVFVYEEARLLIGLEFRSVNTLGFEYEEEISAKALSYGYPRLDIDGTTVEVKGDMKSGKSAVVRAVKVKVSEVRTDYVVYATNPDVTYTVDGIFDFRGSIGVVSYDNEGNIIYRYINDGSEVVNAASPRKANTGSVADFTREMQIENRIIINADSTAEPEDLVGRYVYINNSGAENAVYKICGAQVTDDGKISLDIGKVTLVMNFSDPLDVSSGYEYNIAVGDTLRIPFSYEENSSPIFAAFTGGITTSAKSSFLAKVSASAAADNDGTVTYEARQLPRGAALASNAQLYGRRRSIFREDCRRQNFADDDTLKVVIGSHASWLYEKNWKVWQYIREAMGGKIEISAIPGADFGTKFPLIMATPKDLPGVISFQGSMTGMWSYASQGVFLAFDDNLDKLPNYDKFWNPVPEDEKWMQDTRRYSNGKVYYAPIYGMERQTNVCAWLYRKDVFDKNNLQVPETMDDLYNVCKELKKLYPESYPLSMRSGFTNLSEESNSADNIEELTFLHQNSFAVTAMDYMEQKCGIQMTRIER